MLKRIVETMVLPPLLFLTGCAAFAPEMANIIDSIEDTAVCVEVNDDAMRDDTDIHITVDIINKDIPKARVSEK